MPFPYNEKDKEIRVFPLLLVRGLKILNSRGLFFLIFERKKEKKNQPNRFIFFSHEAQKQTPHTLKLRDFETALIIPNFQLRFTSLQNFVKIWIRDTNSEDKKITLFRKRIKGLLWRAPQLFFHREENSKKKKVRLSFFSLSFTCQHLDTRILEIYLRYNVPGFGLWTPLTRFDNPYKSNNPRGSN